MDESGWSLTESDPQVFTQLLKDLGVQGLQVDDLYSLDSSTLESLQPIHALIFLFKHVGYGDATTEAGVEVDPLDSGVWFANQVINNSCGTLAALNAVMNIPEQRSEFPGETIALGEQLQNLREFGTGMGAMDLGHLVASSEEIRETHNSFSRSRSFMQDSGLDDRPRKKADAYHFVTYLPINGVLYELDGLRPGPRMHDTVESGDGSRWTDVGREVIERRIQAYPEGSLMFNLLAIRSAPIPRLTRLLSSPASDAVSAEQKFAYQDQLEHEQHKAKQGHLENTLRTSNLLPVVFELFKALGEKGDMDKIIEEAKVKGQERRAKRGNEDDE